MANLIWFRTYHGTEAVANLDLLTHAELTSAGGRDDAAVRLTFDREDSVAVETGEESVRVWKAFLIQLPADQQATIEDQRLRERLERIGSDG